jgi:hypothetical protein
MARPMGEGHSLNAWPHLVLGSFFWEGPHSGALPYTKSLMTIVIPTHVWGIHTFLLVDIWTLIIASFSHCMIGNKK